MRSLTRPSRGLPFVLPRKKPGTMRIGPSCTCNQAAWLYAAARSSAIRPSPSFAVRALHSTSTFSGEAQSSAKGKEKERWPGWQPVIGLELHVQLKGNLKLLSCEFISVRVPSGWAGLTACWPSQPRELCTTMSQINTSQPLMMHYQDHFQYASFFPATRSTMA
jgi:hypothetical protein